MRHLLQDFERDSRDLRPCLSGANTMKWMPDTSRENICLNLKVLKDLHNIFHELHSIKSFIVQTADERANIRDTDLRPQNRLVYRETKRLVNWSPILSHYRHGLKAVFRAWAC